jgi:Cu+-exporting ATPase
VVFDKTGTLTSGAPRIAHMNAPSMETKTHCCRWLASLQRGSEHPLAKAVLDACAERGLTVADVTDSQSLTGRGIAGSLDGRRLALGNRRSVGRKRVERRLISRISRSLGKPKAGPCPG